MTKPLLTPRERVSRCMRGLKPDKLPVTVINSNTFMCQYYGATVEDYLQKPALCADLNLRFIQEFEVDCNIVSTGYIFYGAGPELGVEWKFAGENFPGNVSGPIRNKSDLLKMKVPEHPAGYFATYLESISLICDRIGDTHHLKASFLGPFSLVCFLHGLEETLLSVVSDTAFFLDCMAFTTELSAYLGRHLLKTGLRYPILNEIFLAPGMMSPDTYYTHIYPAVLAVQRRIGAELASNSFTFMGLPNDVESRKRDKALYTAFFGVGESIDAVKAASQYRVPGYPYPAAISGRALTAWDAGRIVGFLDEMLAELIENQGIWPSISYASVQADNRETALAIAKKIRAVNRFRDAYEL